MVGWGLIVVCLEEMRAECLSLCWLAPCMQVFEQQPAEWVGSYGAGAADSTDSVVRLPFQRNQLSGSVPTELGQLTALTSLYGRREVWGSVRVTGRVYTGCGCG